MTWEPLFPWWVNRGRYEFIILVSIIPIVLRVFPNIERDTFVAEHSCVDEEFCKRNINEMLIEVGVVARDGNLIGDLLRFAPCGR